jgi:hypothetical protein
MSKSIADKIADHVLEPGPTSELINTGQFPIGWSAEYLRLLRIASDEWAEKPAWPRQLVAAVHFASWYLNLRYDYWCQTSGRRNLQTEKELASLRSPSEIFIMRGSLGRAEHET